MNAKPCFVPLHSFFPASLRLIRAEHIINVYLRWIVLMMHAFPFFFFLHLVLRFIRAAAEIHKYSCVWWEMDRLFQLLHS